MMSVLVRHVRAAPPAAVARSVSEFRRMKGAEGVADGRKRFVDAFEEVFARARDEGELPPEADVGELAQMLQALVMDSILDWANGRADLGPKLRRRGALLLAGVQASVA
jgi:hypothetical protein